MQEEDRKIMEFVGKNTDTYAEKFNKIESGEKSFNWCAFLIPSYWFAYRKMYSYSAITLAALCILEAIGVRLDREAATHYSVYYEWIGLLIYILFLIGFIVLAFKADKIYLSHIRHKLSSKENKDEIIATEGGVSIPAVLIIAAISLAITLLFY